ncbi:hypothetical protein GGX14DRAFT_656367 [Mycena pura]|uniref:F-box domain-containing protein n=1 Tax=Mycena pura TaxID=153505 RepID=A0AAD6V711_9AGAR|nr:hypothetical protein GGX14DRAFT_656367 [Mycena pura]
MASTTQSILLRPRPYAQYAGSFYLVALLPPPRQLPSLPSEIWSAVFKFVAMQPESRALWSLLTVCSMFKELALPLVYSRVRFSKLPSFEKFVAQLDFAEQKWSPIHRIPYSTPGRWVQSLDLSRIEYVGQAEALRLDSLLAKLFYIVPFLAEFSINPSFLLSRRGMDSLGQRLEAFNIRVLEGISYFPSGSSVEEPLTKLLRCCPNLEEVEIIGRGPDPAELDLSIQPPELSLPESFVALHLPRLRMLTILSVYSSPLLLSLLFSPLPSLQKLTITPYDDIPAALSSRFIAAHGASLRSLLLFTPKSWPTRLHPSPQTLLRTSPALLHLSLERPLPSQLDFPHENSHLLQILSVPRPDPDFWAALERLLPRLPALRAIRARDVRWLRRGMGLTAQATGVQGEMMEWRRRLLRRGIRLLDGEWKEFEM